MRALKKLEKVGPQTHSHSHDSKQGPSPAGLTSFSRIQCTLAFMLLIMSILNLLCIAWPSH